MTMTLEEAVRFAGKKHLQLTFRAGGVLDVTDGEGNIWTESWTEAINSLRFAVHHARDDMRKWAAQKAAETRKRNAQSAEKTGAQDGTHD